VWFEKKNNDTLTIYWMVKSLMTALDSDLQEVLAYGKLQLAFH